MIVDTRKRPYEGWRQADLLEWGAIITARVECGELLERRRYPPPIDFQHRREKVVDVPAANYIVVFRTENANDEGVYRGYGPGFQCESFDYGPVRTMCRRHAGLKEDEWAHGERTRT